MLEKYISNNIFGIFNENVHITSHYKLYKIKTFNDGTIIELK